MAVVISQEQNEIQRFKKWDLDIIPHRQKMEKRELDREYKDKDNPFRVFYCRTNSIAFTMAGGMEIKASEDYKFAEDLLAVLGKASFGADLVVKGGIIKVSIAKAT